MATILKGITLMFVAAGFLYTRVAGVKSGCQEISNVQITHYGAPDNSPPSPDIGTNCFGHNMKAGGRMRSRFLLGFENHFLTTIMIGTGTATDPITFASADGEFDNCELIYIPLFRKYFYKGDSCAQCQTDWKSKQWHVDLWTGSTNNGGQTQINCEDRLPGGKQLVIRHPSANLTVDSKLNAILLTYSY